MCTLSWWIEPGRRGILFNRDEQHSRQSGTEPGEFQAKDEHACKVLAPVDPDAGGTWIGVNEHGLIVALLNYYGHDATEVDQRRSRGKLVLDLLSAQQSAPDCIQSVDTGDLSPYPGFLIFCMDRGNEPIARQWDGRALSALALDPQVPCLTTSSVRTEVAVKYRRSLFRGLHTMERLKEAHLHYNPEDSGLGPLMSRDDAATDCLTEIILGDASAQMSFQSFDGDPPQVAGSAKRSLPLTIC